MELDVRHDPELRRFVARVEGHACVCEYELEGKVMRIHYTGVPPAVGGRGIAAALVRVALDWARSQDLQVIPSCSYVAAYMRRHRETQDLLAR